MTQTLDAASDLAVAALALWTVSYHVALAVAVPTNVLLCVWGASVAVTAIVFARRTSSTAQRGPRSPAVPSRVLAVSSRVLAVSSRWLGARGPRVLGVAVALVVVSSAALVSQSHRLLWWVGWAVAVSLVAVMLIRPTEDSRRVGDPCVDVAPVGRSTEPAPWLAILVAIGLGVISLFTFYIDSDDAFYVNKSSWVAERGTIATGDTLYTDQRLDHLAGAGVPIQSIESLYGAVAHALGLSAGTVVYLVAPPIVAMAAIWALWRLVRAWARRRPSLAFIVASGYVAVSLLGSWTMLRLWMGKAIFFALLIPLIYLYLTRWLARRGRRDGLLLFAAGVTAVGLTSSATVLVVVLSAAAAVALLVRAGVRAAAGALLLSVYPVAVGVWVSLLSPPGDPGGEFLVGRAAFEATYGAGIVAAIAWAALVSAGLLARPGAARTVAIVSALATAGVLLPLVPRLIDAVTGSGAILYRLVFLAPMPVMVGLLATVSVPVLRRRARWLAVMPAAILLAALFAAGTAYWDRVPWRSPPAWKVDPVALRQARAILAMAPGPGPVLAPRTTMTAIGITTTRIHAVSPNASYVYRGVIPEAPVQTAARVTLHRFMFQHPLVPDLAAAPEALHRLGVSMVCLYPSQTQARAVVEHVGYTVVVGETGGLSCLTKP